jgi:TRAP-type mannitol/chloroaromatic compound transport system permease small subunit
LRWSAGLKQFSETCGRVIAWLALPMVLVTFVIVLLRYVFDQGWIWMQESVLWMHSAVFMLAAAYTLNRGEHVRVDIFYRGLDARRKALVDILGTLLFLLPMMVFLIVSSLDYAMDSWSRGEGSREAGGLPFPAVPLLKTMIPLAAGLLILQGIANLLADCSTLLGRGQGRDGAGGSGGSGGSGDGGPGGRG